MLLTVIFLIFLPCLWEISSVGAGMFTRGEQGKVWMQKRSGKAFRGVSCVVFLQDNYKGNGSRRGTEFMHVRKLWMETRLL